MDLSLHGLAIGSLEIRFYSLSILAGLLIGMLLASKEAKRLGENPDHIANIAVLGALLAIIGARLYHVFDQNEWPYYRENPEAILYVWRGGIGIFGAFVGAVIGLVIYVRLKSLNLLRWMDIGAPAFLIGQAVGRWGNFFNQELFGRPTDLPWGISIPVDRVMAEAPQYAGFEKFHPLFLYESILSFLGVAFMLIAARRFAKFLRPGDIFLIYLVWYPAERFLLEFLRAEKWVQGGIPMAQWVGISLILFSIVLFILNHRRTNLTSEVTGIERSTLSRAAQRRRKQRN